MTATRTIATLALGLALSSSALHAQARSRYRDFQLGSTLASVSALTNVPATEANALHKRPALVQELVWILPNYLAGSITPKTDPVQQIAFSFYNDQLSRLIVDYDRGKTAGLTDNDMIDALTASYGPPQKAQARRPATASRTEMESGTLLARWGDADYSVVLYRSSDFFKSSPGRYRLIVTSPGLQALAETASAEADRIDAREAPQREADRQKQDATDARAAEEKARLANKGTFRP